MKHYSWSNINEFFDALNKRCNYVILRNYEEITETNFLCEGHADIDFLTDDVCIFVDTMKAYPRFVTDDLIHYFVNISGIEVEVDVRHVGDDYYCKKWELKMLESKKRINNFYVLDDINYYYSLIYHAVLQKDFLSNEYKKRLYRMAQNNMITANSETEQLNELIKFMKKHSYIFCYPDDYCVPLRVNLVPSKMVRKYYKVVIRKIKWKTLGKLSKIKRKILR